MEQVSQSSPLVSFPKIRGDRKWKLWVNVRRPLGLGIPAIYGVDGGRSLAAIDGPSLLLRRASTSRTTAVFPCAYQSTLL